MIRWREVIPWVVGSVLVCLGVFGYLLHRRMVADERTLALHRTMKSLDIGDSVEKVREVANRWRTKDMLLHEVSTNAWILEGPPDWSTEPVNLYIDFATGRLSKLRARFQEYTNIHPAELPNDKE